MDNTTVFMRGQVWQWKDPIYGKKDIHKNVAIGEGCMRYSRFVVIVQTNNTISDNHTILVMPCSSSLSSSSDVKIDINSQCTNMTEPRSYIRTNLIMPISVKSLTKYICTLQDDVMISIERKILASLSPTIMSHNFVKPISDLTGLQLSSMTANNDITLASVVDDKLKSFIINHVVIGDITDTTKMYDILNEYNKFKGDDKVDEKFNYKVLTALGYFDNNINYNWETQVITGATLLKIDDNASTIVWIDESTKPHIQYISVPKLYEQMKLFATDVINKLATDNIGIPMKKITNMPADDFYNSIRSILINSMCELVNYDKNDKTVTSHLDHASKEMAYSISKYDHCNIDKSALISNIIPLFNKLLRKQSICSPNRITNIGFAIEKIMTDNYR